jgi:two-component system chemotaxis response regulator CheB
VPDSVRREQLILSGDLSMQNLEAIADPSTLTCPDCGGGLWELKDKQPLRYRCHTGHGFTARSLEGLQAGTTEHSLWSAVRSLQERQMLLRRVAAAARAAGQHAQAEAGEREADRLAKQAKDVQRIVEGDGTDA